MFENEVDFIESLVVVENKVINTSKGVSRSAQLLFCWGCLLLQFACIIHLDNIGIKLRRFWWKIGKYEWRTFFNVILAASGSEQTPSADPPLVFRSETATVRALTTLDLIIIAKALNSKNHSSIPAHYMGLKFDFILCDKLHCIINLLNWSTTFVAEFFSFLCVL